MKKAQLIPYTWTFSKRVITNYAKIREVVWREGQIYCVNVKSYINLKKEFFDNLSFVYPKIPFEILSHVYLNKEEYI